MNFQMNKLMVVGTVTTMLGATLAQAAFASHDKVTTITTRNYATPVTVVTPMTVATPVIISQPAVTTTTVRTIEAPAVVAQPVVVERTVLTAPIVQERRVEVLNTNIVPTTTSTTVTRTTTLTP